MSDLVGKTLGKYQIIERVGQGGMAEVYRAFQPGLDRFVAIKVVHSFLLQDESFLGRFRREAQAVADLRHPNIVSVFDFDVQDERPYMVLEFIEGVTLGDVIDSRANSQRTLELSEVLWLMQALCSAVGYAHKQGIVHRDINPNNVMLTVDQRVILTDFGLVRILGGAKFTATGQVTGTPEYMAPEQAHGEPGDQRSDIYALGILIFEALTAQVPYQGETPVSILLKHVSYPVPSIREIKADIPESLEEVIRKALAKNPDERFQTAEDFWNEIRQACPEVVGLERLVPSEFVPATSRPAPTEQIGPVTKQIEVNKFSRMSGILLGLNVLAISALAFFFYHLSNSNEVIEQPNIPASKSKGEPKLPSEAVAALCESANTQMQSGDFKQALETYRVVLKQEPRSLTALIGRAQALIELGQVSEAEADIQAASDIAPSDPRPRFLKARQTLKSNPNANWASVKALIDSAVLLAPSSAESFYTRGWAVLSYQPAGASVSASGEKGIDCFPEWARIAESGHAAEALPDLQRAVDLAPGQREYRLSLADALFFTHSLPAAREQVRAALNIAPGYYPALWREAVLSTYLSDFATASSDFTAILGSPLGQKEPGRWFANRAFALYRKGDLSEARRDVEAALSASAENPAALFVQGLISLAQSQEDALPLLEKVVAVSPKQYDCPLLNERNNIEIHAALGQGLIQKKDFKAATEHCGQAINLLPKASVGYLCRGLARAGLKQLGPAKEDLERALSYATVENEREQIQAALEKYIPKPMPTPTPVSVPVVQKTPGVVPVPTQAVEKVPAVGPGKEDLVWASITLTSGGATFRDNSLDAKNLPNISWSVKMTGINSRARGAFEQKIRSALQLRVFDPAQNAIVKTLSFSDISGEGTLDSPAVIGGSLRELESVVPKVNTQRWSELYRIEVVYSGQVLTKRDLTLYKVQDSRSEIEAAKKKENEVDPAIPTLGNGAEQERYLGRLIPGGREIQSMNIDLQLEYRDGKVAGSADISDQGRFAVSGEVFPRGMEIQLRREGKTIRLSLGPRGAKIRGRYGFPALSQQGTLEAERR